MKVGKFPGWGRTFKAKSKDNDMTSFLTILQEMNTIFDQPATEQTLNRAKEIASSIANLNDRDYKDLTSSTLNYKYPRNKNGIVERLGTPANLTKTIQDPPQSSKIKIYELIEHTGVTPNHSQNIIDATNNIAEKIIRTFALALVHNPNYKY